MNLPLGSLPERIENEEALEELLSRPTPGVLEFVRSLEGDCLILGVGGKMGPTLARQLKRALVQMEKPNRVIGVSRFGEPGLRSQLEEWGIETLAADLLEPGSLQSLPDAENVFYLAVRKFGSTGDEEYTWAMNVFLPGLVAERYSRSRIVSLSTGNVYPLIPVHWGGSLESDPVAPVGEYAQSCVGRERMFQYFSKKMGTPVALMRLNYAVELRYGILLDLAQKVYAGTPIPLAMGNVNVIWQGDANACIIQALGLCASPPRMINLTGPEILSIRRLAETFSRQFERTPRFDGMESETALLSHAGQAFGLFGYPAVALERLIHWVAHWVQIGGPTLNKPTHYEEREGKF